MKTVISNVRPYGGEAVDIEITDGVISNIAPANSLKADIDGKGLVALPGLVDLHTHLREPGREDSETVATGTLASWRHEFPEMLYAYAAAERVPAVDPVPYPKNASSSSEMNPPDPPPPRAGCSVPPNRRGRES